MEVDLTSETKTCGKRKAAAIGNSNKKQKLTIQKFENEADLTVETKTCGKRKAAGIDNSNKKRKFPIQKFENETTSSGIKTEPVQQKLKKELSSNSRCKKERNKLENEHQQNAQIKKEFNCTFKEEQGSSEQVQYSQLSKYDQNAASNLCDESIIAESTNVPIHVAKNVIKLLDQECTVPFIARYRKEMTGNLPAEKIREIQLSYESIKNVHKKVDNILKTLGNNADKKITSALKSARTMEEVEYLYAPLKPGSKRSLAERARKLGLECYAAELLEGQKNLLQINFEPIVDANVPGKATEAEIMKGIQNIIADVIAKDREILDFIHSHPDRQLVRLCSNESATAKKNQKKAFVEGKETKNFKFENYFKFSAPVKNVNAHQVLAVNRGENQKILTVKLVIPPQFERGIMQKCWSKFFGFKMIDSRTTTFFETCIKDAYIRLIEPLICRQIRSELTKKAATESVAVFCSNLKRLLLTPPVRGKTVIGIDPGFKHGCKVSVVSCSGEVLQTDVIYLPSSRKGSFACVEKLVNMVSTHIATLIAIGNGTGCREMEAWLSDLIKKNMFYPHNVKYCIIDESGASIYSVTKDAELELPGMDPNLRSAVSIARRLQDPLLEYVKVEPKHLGIGMYQHDIPEHMLKSALNSVVVECVSFVGVDLNVCPEVLLQKVSGLSTAKVKKIIDYREKNGSFINRQQLLQVKGLGPKSYEQCAGFVKIFPETSVKGFSSKLKSGNKGITKKEKSATTLEPNLLDTTVIHPESYETAKKFLIELKADTCEIGQQSLVDKVQNYMRSANVQHVAQKFGIAVEQMQLIIDAFKQLMHYDFRNEFEVPLFKTGVVSLSDLSVNQVLTGRVSNVTSFGAFVDIGVGQDGLIHVSKMNSYKINFGDRVTVRILNVDIPKKRISLGLCSKL